MNRPGHNSDETIRPSYCRRIRQSHRLDGRAGDIMQVARGLFETQGVRNSSFSSIADACQVTRSLMYYYFPTKEDLIQAVLDDYIEDVLDTISVWNECRHFGNTQGELLNCICAFRRVLYTSHGTPRPMFGVIDELGIRDEFNARVIREAVDLICSNIVPEYVAYHNVEIQYIPEMFALVLFGVVGLLRAYPDISDKKLATIISQTLRLDAKPIQIPDDRITTL